MNPEIFEADESFGKFNRATAAFSSGIPHMQFLDDVFLILFMRVR